MTIQQLEYIVALNRHRHFVKASEHCHVTQPTLSTMIQKLETELEVDIFDRSKQPVQPTEIGKQIIAQAERALREIRNIKELVLDEKESLRGKLEIGVIPTLATYLVPKFIQQFINKYEQVDLTMTEMNTATLIESLKNGKIDMFIAATPLEEEELLEVPIFYEQFVAYFSAGHPYLNIPLTPDNMPKENLWVLEEGHCLRDQVFNFCHSKLPFSQTFEAGSIDTLVRIVDMNGGYTLIPELHLPFLSGSQSVNVRKIEDPPAIREVSIVLPKDFIREKLINAVAETLKSIIPEYMLNERLKKFSIRL